jgi:hypothetical protein
MQMELFLCKAQPDNCLLCNLTLERTRGPVNTDCNAGALFSRKLLTGTSICFLFYFPLDIIYELKYFHFWNCLSRVMNLKLEDY